MPCLQFLSGHRHAAAADASVFAGASASELGVLCVPCNPIHQGPAGEASGGHRSGPCAALEVEASCWHVEHIYCNSSVYS